MTAELALAVHVLVSFPVEYLHWCIRVFTLISAGGVMYDLQFDLAPMFFLAIFWLLEVIFSAQLAKALWGCGRVRLTIANMDADANQEIDIEEFVRAGGTREDFEQLDADGSGTVSQTELDAYQDAGHTLYRRDDFDNDPLRESSSPLSGRVNPDITEEAQALATALEEAEEKEMEAPTSLIPPV